MSPAARRFRSYGEVADPGRENLLEQVLEQRRRLAQRLTAVQRVVAVVSGKGGVGKSAITANLATLLASGGLRIGVVDADLNGPTIARMLGAPRASLQLTADGMLPARGSGGVAFMSTDLLLSGADAPMRWKGPRDDGFIWRGALEAGTIREFLSDIVWGPLDFLFIDVPPGTDRIERLLDLVTVDSILLVTTPASAALHVVGRSARLLQEAGVGSIGLIVNMSGYTCPSCGESTAIFPGASPPDYHLLGDLTPWVEIPFDPVLAATTDSGRPFVLAEPRRPAAVAFRVLADRLRREVRP